MRGLITKSAGLWYEVKSDNITYIARLRGKFKLDEKKLTNPLSVGDEVEIIPNDQVDGEYVIVKIYDRVNYVIRQSTRKKGFDHIIASNVDQGVVLATLKKPRTSTGFIDRFLITLEAFRIPGIIIFNKQDIYSKSDIYKYEELSLIYRKIGYQVQIVSLQKNGCDEIREIFNNKRTLISGHSGSGKSTLVNLLVPSARQDTNEISSFANKGVHTTTFAEYFEIDSSSSIIDTPGIKELGLAEVEKEELSHYFPEMREFLGECKFHNCLHENEPGCRIKEEVGKSISPMRYQSYLSILNSDDSFR